MFLHPRQNEDCAIFHLAQPANERPDLNRPVALMVEHRTPNPGVGGSSPSWPAIARYQKIKIDSGTLGDLSDKKESQKGAE